MFAGVKLSSLLSRTQKMFYCADSWAYTLKLSTAVITTLTVSVFVTSSNSHSCQILRARLEPTLRVES
jgi:hypothetical protein